MQYNDENYYQLTLDHQHIQEQLERYHLWKKWLENDQHLTIGNHIGEVQPQTLKTSFVRPVEVHKVIYAIDTRHCYQMKKIQAAMSYIIPHPDHHVEMHCKHLIDEFRSVLLLLLLISNEQLEA